MQGGVLAAAGRAEREALGPCWAHEPSVAASLPLRASATRTGLYLRQPWVPPSPAAHSLSPEAAALWDGCGQRQWGPAWEQVHLDSVHGPAPQWPGDCAPESPPPRLQRGRVSGQGLASPQQPCVVTEASNPRGRPAGSPHACLGGPGGAVRSRLPDSVPSTVSGRF